MQLETLKFKKMENARRKVAVSTVFGMSLDKQSLEREITAFFPQVLVFARLLTKPSPMQNES